MVSPHDIINVKKELEGCIGEMSQHAVRDAIRPRINVTTAEKSGVDIPHRERHIITLSQKTKNQVLCPPQGPVVAE